MPNATNMRSDADPAFRPGFRFAATDAVVLLVGAVGAAMAWRIEPAIGIAVLLPVAMFFVFCNVVRMVRTLELVWAFAHAVGCAWRIQCGWPAWPWIVGGSLGLAMVLVGLQLRRADYHGIAWQRVNPSLPAWWEERGSRPGRADQARQPDDVHAKDAVTKRKGGLSCRG